MNASLDEDEELLAQLAERLARKAGRLVVDMRADALDTATTKSSPTDPVTAADRAAERIIVDGISAARPEDGVIGEEGTDTEGGSGYQWIVDPIDGTVNYLYGIPAYSVSIAARGPDGHIVAGVVFNPTTDELFRAVRGGGAWLNGKPIFASTTAEVASALVGTGFAYGVDRRKRQGQIAAELLGSIRDIRRGGSAALDLCSVACGRLDAYYEAGLNPWDYAAGWLIASEAGANCHDLHRGSPGTKFFFASNSMIHDQLGDLLRRLEADKLPNQ